MDSQLGGGPHLSQRALHPHMLHQRVTLTDSDSRDVLALGHWARVLPFSQPGLILPSPGNSPSSTEERSLPRGSPAFLLPQRGEEREEEEGASLGDKERVPDIAQEKMECWLAGRHDKKQNFDMHMFFRYIFHTFGVHFLLGSRSEPTSRRRSCSKRAGH